MRKEEIITVERKVEVVTCDVCRREMQQKERKFSCAGCQRDLCDSCVVSSVPDIFDACCNGTDDDLCQSCYGVLGTFREQVQAIHDRHSMDIERGRKIFLLACKYGLEPD